MRQNYTLTIKPNQLTILLLLTSSYLVNYGSNGMNDGDEDSMSIKETIESGKDAPVAGNDVDSGHLKDIVGDDGRVGNDGGVNDAGGSRNSSQSTLNQLHRSEESFLEENQLSNINVDSNQDQNKTINSTINESKVDCSLTNLTDTEVPMVKIVNSSKLFEYLSPLPEAASGCVMVLFYYPWCSFSAKSARPYNALGKLFPQMNVLALDAYLYNSVNMRFGLVGIPTILFFHNGKMVAKYNSTESNIDSLVSFVNRLTGLQPDPAVNVTEEDFSGPVPTEPRHSVDYVLIFSSVFLLLTICYLIAKSTIFKKIIESIRNTWREAEAQHQHLD